MKRLGPTLRAGILLAVGLASLWPILRTGDWYSANQAYRYPYLMELFKASFLAGHAYPRWLPELFGGYGYPTFIFYPPGLWFFALPFALVFADVLHAMYAALVALFWLGGLGAYRLGRLTLGPWHALFCAVLFLLTPYVSVQLYTRGSLAELAAMLLCPWVFLCLLRLKRALGEQRPAAAPALMLGLALAAMVTTHLLLTLWLGLAIAGVLATLLIGRDWPRGFLPALLISGVLAVALASPYWYPALALRDAVMYQRALWAGPPIGFGELIALRPRMTGLPWSAVALAGFWLGRKDRLMQGVALSCAILLFFMLPTSSALWQRSRMLQVTQHPGRIFSVFATLQLLASIGCVGALARLARFNPRRQAVAALLALLVVGATVSGRYRVWDRLDYARYRFEAAHSFEDMTHNHEMQPRGSSIEGLPQRLRSRVPVAQAGDGATLSIESRRDDDILVRAEVASPPVTITLNQLAFPGWRLSLDGRPLPRCSGPEGACWQREGSGRMRVLLPAAGSFVLHAWFDGAPDWLARSAAASIALIGCLVALPLLDKLKDAPSGGRGGAR